MNKPNNNSEEFEFRMPAEWAPHFGTWVAWPHNRETWANNLAEARDEFNQLITAIGETDKHVYVCLNDDAMSDDFRLSVQHQMPSNLILCQVPTNDAWTRDYAPTFVINSTPRPSNIPSIPPWFPTENRRLSAIDWRYNAWGGKYPPFDDDQKVAKHISVQTGVKRIESSLHIEGGALEVNGTGTLLTTKSCVMNSNRNPNWTQEDIESELKRNLGVHTVVWLTGDAILGDDTDGHIDQLARFVNETTIVYAWTSQDDPQYEALAKNLSDLKTGLAEHALNYDLIPLKLPDNPVTFREHRLPASYCNFYITNGAVIVPQFGDSNDDSAVEKLRDLFPGRAIIPLASNHLSVGLGSFHCLTQQMPAAHS